MEQLLLSLDLFHRKKIIHRDIKLDNILINQIQEDQYDIRVADFGLATFTFNDELVQRKCGSPGFSAPEIFISEGYNYKCDIFSLGTVFYSLLTSKYLFGGNDPNEVL